MNDVEGTASSLAGRISSTKLYLMSETSVSKAAGKRKHDEDGEELSGDQDGDTNMTDEFDPNCRANAILMSGPPISHLPTARLFAYTKHFDVQPMGLEWINDNTCVFVFPSKITARSAYNLLQKSVAEGPDEEGFVTAKSIPVAMWPAEERINNSLGKGQGLKGTIRMRWALHDDVKKKRAMEESEFYRKHGRMAGKEIYGGEGVPPAVKRRRQDGPEGQGDVLDEAAQRALLDAELDQFLAEDAEGEETGDAPASGSPPSRMRSDYIANDGRTVLDSPSERLDLASRITAPLPRRAASRKSGLAARISSLGDRPERPHSGRGGRGERRPPRHEPRKVTQEELDAEMDAFWSQKK